MTDKRIRIILDSKSAEKNAKDLDKAVVGVGISADNIKNQLSNISLSIKESINTAKSAVSGFISTASRRISLFFDSKSASKNATDLTKKISTVGTTADKSQFQVNKLTQEIRKSIDATKNSLAGFLSVYGALRALKGVSTISDEYAALNGQLKIATESQEEFNLAQQEVFRIAQETRSSLSETASTYATLERATKNLKVSQTEIFGVLETVNKSIALTSPSAQSAQAALVQFGQALGGDFKNGSQELNSILEQTPGLAMAIADGLGVATSDLKTLGEQGKLSAELVFTALQSVSDKVNRDFVNVPQTVSGALTQLRNDLVVTFGENVDTSGLTIAISELRDTLTDPNVAAGLTTIAEGLVNLTGFAAGAATEFANLGNQLGYLAAYVSGNTTELDDLKQELEDVDRALRGGFWTTPVDRLFTSDEGLKKEREDLSKQIEAIEGVGSASIKTDEEIKAASEAKAKASSEAYAEKVKELKLEQQIKIEEEKEAKERERKAKAIDSEIAKLREQSSTFDQSIEATTRYKLETLGATTQQIELAASIARTIDQLKSQKELQATQEKVQSEVSGSDSVTEGLKRELELRRAISDIYRSAELDADSSFYNQQRAMLEAKQQEEIAILESKATADTERRNEQFRQAIEIENISEQQRAEIKTAYDEQEKAASELKEEELTAIREKGKIAREELDRAEYQARLANAGALGNALIQLGQGQSKKIFKVGQTLALAQAAVALPSAVLESFKNGGGYPWGLIPAAAMLATGIKQIQQIKSAGAGLGGGGGSVPAPSLGGGSGASSINTNQGAQIEQVQQRRIIDLRNVKLSDKIPVSALVELLQEDGAVVALESARDDASRRGVIGVTAR